MPVSVSTSIDFMQKKDTYHTGPIRRSLSHRIVFSRWSQLVILRFKFTQAKSQQCGYSLKYKQYWQHYHYEKDGS
jgi:hypothetical protein